MENFLFLISQCLISEFSFFVVSWTKMENFFINPSSFDGYYLVPSVLFVTLSVTVSVTGLRASQLVATADQD